MSTEVASGMPTILRISSLHVLAPPHELEADEADVELERAVEIGDGDAAVPRALISHGAFVATASSICAMLLGDHRIEREREACVLLEDRVAFVTGAGSGIGREIAELFAREGARIAAFDRSREAATSSSRARAGRRAIASLRRGGRARPGGRRARVQSVVDATGRIDILVNCAGVREIGDVYTMPAEEWENVIAINLSGTFYCCQSVGAADARLRRRQHRQPLFGRRPDRALASPRLHGVEARDRRPDEEPRARSRAGRHPRQRALPRRDPDADDRAVLLRRQLRAGARRLGAARALRRSRRRRQGGAVPRERPVGLYSPASPCRSTVASWPRRASSPARAAPRSCPGTRRATSASGSERDRKPCQDADGRLAERPSSAARRRGGCRAAAR